MVGAHAVCALIERGENALARARELEKQSDGAEAVRQFGTARTLLTEAIRLSDNKQQQQQLLALRASCYLGQGQFELALADCDSALASNSMHVTALECKARVAAAMRISDDWQLRKRLGNYLFKCGRFDEAVDVYAQAKSTCTSSEQMAILETNTATCHLSAGRYTQCVATCDLALQMDPNSVRAYERKAQALNAAGKAEDAIAVLDSALARSKDSDVLVNLRNEIQHTRKAPPEQVAVEPPPPPRRSPPAYRRRLPPLTSPPSRRRPRDELSRCGVEPPSGRRRCSLYYPERYVKQSWRRDDRPNVERVPHFVRGQARSRRGSPPRHPIARSNGRRSHSARHQRRQQNNPRYQPSPEDEPKAKPEVEQQPEGAARPAENLEDVDNFVSPRRRRLQEDASHSESPDNNSISPKHPLSIVIDPE